MFQRIIFIEERKSLLNKELKAEMSRFARDDRKAEEIHHCIWNDLRNKDKIALV